MFISSSLFIVYFLYLYTLCQAVVLKHDRIVLLPGIHWNLAEASRKYCFIYVHCLWFIFQGPSGLVVKSV